MRKFILTESQYNTLLKEMSNDISYGDVYNNVLNNPNNGVQTPNEKELGTFDGWQRVRRKGVNKMNLKNTQTGNYISNIWYDFVGSLINGIAIVIDNNRGVNAINTNGELLFKSWHEDINVNKDGEEYIIKDGPRVVVRSRVDLLNNPSLNESTMKEIDDASKEVNLNPTEAQKEAGNYKMAHVSVKGMAITIENPKGSKRYYGKEDSNGNRKYNLMKNHYGYFTKSLGKDGDAVDVFIGPNVDNFERVYCIDQKMKGEFDETKVMLGFNSKKEAKEAYLSNYADNWKGFMAITSVPIKAFKKWLYRGRKQRQPFKDYVEIKKKQLTESVADTEKNKIFYEYVEKAKSFIEIYEKHARNYYFKNIFEDIKNKNFRPEFFVKATDRAIKELQDSGLKLNYYKGR